MFAFAIVIIPAFSSSLVTVASSEGTKPLRTLEAHVVGNFTLAMLSLTTARKPWFADLSLSGQVSATIAIDAVDGLTIVVESFRTPLEAFVPQSMLEESSVESIAHPDIIDERDIWASVVVIVLRSSQNA